jgi:poly [ADP-ribose] polymerase
MTAILTPPASAPAPFPDTYTVLASSVLSKTSLEANNNKFYVLEVHEGGPRQFRLFTHYGRVGSAGVKETRDFDTQEAASDAYAKLLREKTSPRKGYVLVEVEKAAVGSEKLQVAAGKECGTKPSVLAPEIAGFIEHIFDESKSELVRRIETPLGSLSKSQIERGADALREIRFAIARDHQDKIVPLTSRYYSLVPHRLGRWTDINDVSINSIEKADTEEELLQLMRDVYHLQGDLESETDRKYRALGANLSVVSPHDPAYKQVERRVLDTQSARHGFKIKVNKIFTAELPEERRRFEADGKTVGNLQGLFHGTKNCNMAGILSRGLLIAPKNAPVSGYMFGKGIYFADQSSKSAQYSLVWARNKRDIGYLFLADVALGKIKSETAPTYREEAPRGYHSVQGCKGTHLIHNEFIIYKTSQCTLRYIAEIAMA